MRVLVFIALVQTYACKDLSRPRSVNLALETVVEFNNNDNSADMHIIDKMRNFLDQVKFVIDKNKNYRRSLSSGKLKFTDFLKHALGILSSYEDSDLEDVISVLDDELRKYHYKGCKFHELVENINVRRFMANNLEKVKNAPVEEVKMQMKKMLNKFENDNFDLIQKVALGYINSLYDVGSEDKFRDVLGKLATYRRRTKRSNLNLVKVVRDGIRSVIFDHYSGLDYQARRDLKLKLETFWQDFSHPERNQHQVWNFKPVNKNIKRSNENFKDRDDVGSTSIEIHKSSKKPKRSRQDHSRHKAKRQRVKHSTRRRHTFITLYPEEITLLEKRKHKKKSTKSVRQLVTHMRIGRQKSKSKNKKKKKALREIIAEHDAEINVERQVVDQTFPAYEELLKDKSRQISQKAKKRSRFISGSSNAARHKKRVYKKHGKIRRENEIDINTPSLESEEGLSIGFESRNLVKKSFRKSNLNDTLSSNNASIAMTNKTTGNLTSSSIPPDGNVIKRINDLEKELSVVKAQMKVTKDSHERSHYEPIDFWEGTTKDMSTTTPESTTKTTTSNITTTTPVLATKTTTVATTTTTELTTKAVSTANAPVFRSQDTKESEKIKKTSAKKDKKLSQNKITGQKEDSQRNVTGVKSKVSANFEVPLKYPKIDDYNDIKGPEMNFTGIEDIERYLNESKPIGDEKTQHIVRKKMLEQLKGIFSVNHEDDPKNAEFYSSTPSIDLGATTDPLNFLDDDDI